MRPDLNKLLCERERRGSRAKYKTVRRSKKFAVDLDPEDGSVAVSEGIKFRYGYDTKDFNENLNPLKGQIRKFVGKPWDKFYSELSKVFDKRSVINQHIIQHLKDFIEKDVIVKDGKFCIREKWGLPDRPLSQSHCEFFVHPKTGIIQVNKYQLNYKAALREHCRRKAEEEAKIFRQIDDLTELRKINDTWFIFDLAPIPAYPVWDIYKRELVSRQKHGKNLYYVKRRTASRKFIKQYDLL